MSILTAIQDAATELGLVAPTSVVAATTDLVAQQLLAFANRSGRALRNEFDWPQLEKEHTFTLSDGVDSYAMPGDFERFAFSTHWDRSNNWEMAGPISAQDWQTIKSGGLSVATFRRWRFKNFTTKQFYFADTPSSSDAGNTIVFEYYSTNWLRPKLWVTATAFAAGSWCFYNGNYYSTVAGGTTGATPPTHVTGSASDGTVAWVYSSAAYERAAADTDVSHIDENLLTLHIKWRYRQAKTLEGWEVMKADADAETQRLANANAGASPVNLNVGGRFQSDYYPRIPQTIG